MEDLCLLQLLLRPYYKPTFCPLIVSSQNSGEINHCCCNLKGYSSKNIDDFLPEVCPYVPSVLFRSLEG